MSRENFPDWQSHEREIAELLGIDMTVSSGNKFYDISDAVSREHILDNRVQFMADAKSTLNRSYRIDRDFLKDYREKSIIRGKIFLLPIRFEDNATEEKHDWILVHANDFSELLGLEIKSEAIERKKFLDERALEITKALDEMSDSLYNIIDDGNVPDASKRDIVKLLDIMDKITIMLMKKEDR